jgi:prophage antirepressor-like protein
MDQQAVQLFNFEQEVKVSVITDKNNNPWWVAKEVADILGFRDAHNAIRGLDTDEKDTHIMSTPGGMQECRIVNEPGLYTMILKSRKPAAKKFKRWVTHEVIPTIRKSGGYIAGAENMDDTQILIRALEIREAQLEAKDKLIEDLQPKAIAHDNVIDFSDSMTTTSAAKQLGISAFRLNKALSEMGVLFRQFNYGATKAYSWVPKQPYIDKGLFEVKMGKYYSHGEERYKPQTLVTPEGLAWLTNKLAA